MDRGTDTATELDDDTSIRGRSTSIAGIDGVERIRSTSRPTISENERCESIHVGCTAPSDDTRLTTTACKCEFEFSKWRSRFACERYIRERTRFLTRMLLMLKRQVNSLYPRGYLMRSCHCRTSIQTISSRQSCASRHPRQRQSGG